MKYYILFATLLIAWNFYAQEVTGNIKDKFLIHLYQDDAFTFKDGKGKVNYKYSYLDSLELPIKKMEFESSQYLNIDFYKFDLNDLDKSMDSISLKKNFPECNSFILAINLESIYNYTYRLKGFSTNDLLFLIHDLAKKEKNGMKVKKIVKELDLVFNDLNIDCIYNSIINLDLDSECIKTDCYRSRPWSIKAHKQ